MLHCCRYSCAIAAIVFLASCSSATTSVEDTPFREAIARYLQSNNMAMKIKELKEGPIVEGDLAHLTASMVHQQLEGPSVTWKFQFAKQSDGTWQVTKCDK